MYFSFSRTGVLRCAMLLLCFFALPTAWAQTSQNAFEGIRQEVGYVIQPLDKSQIPTGYLHEYGYLLYAPDEYKGIRTDTNHVQPPKWEVVYGSLQSSYIYGTQSMPDLETVRAKLKSYKGRDATIALPILHEVFISTEKQFFAK